MQEWVRAIDFGCDIVGQLPLEIGEKIAWYLPLHDIVAAQRVSHKWSRIFTTSHTLKPLLRDWYDDASSTAVSALKTEQVDAYRTGSAFSFRGGKWDILNPTYGYMDSVAYADGVLAWIDKSAKHVFVRQLETGREQQISLKDKGHTLKHVAVSASYVAATGRFSESHIWDLNTAKSLWDTSHNTCIDAVALFGDIFVEQRNPRFSHSVMPAEFTIWEFESLPVSSRCFSIDLHKDSRDRSPATKLMFQHTGKFLVIFEHLRNSTGDSFYSTRVGITGQVQSTCQLFVEKPPYTARPGAYDYSAPPAYGAFTTASALTDVCTVVWVYDESCSTSKASTTVLKCTHVVYDSVQGKLMLKEISVPVHGDTPAQVTAANFFWKDVAYFRSPSYSYSDNRSQIDNSVCPHSCRKPTVLNVLDFNEGICRRAQMSKLAEPKDDAKQKCWLSSEFLGDGRFLINFNNKEFRIWGFEKHTPIGGEDMRYKKARELVKSNGKADGALTSNGLIIHIDNMAIVND